MYSFIGFVPGDNLPLNDQARLFIEYLAAVRHRHMAEPLSSTKFYMESMQWHDEPARCDICDRKLNWQIEKPEWIKDHERAHAPPRAA